MIANALQFSYIQEWDSQFLSLFPHRFDYIYAPLPQPGEKPQWRTESRHPLSDRILSQGSSLFGVRFGPNTCYALIDLDITSPYHPQQDVFALNKLLSSLEPLNLTQPLICTSSHNGGLHLYFPFKKPQRSWKLAAAIAALLTANGFKLRPGQLEVFPNSKVFIKEGSPSLFNAHRLPLQEPGSRLLNINLEPIWSSQEHLVQLWQRCANHNIITTPKIQAVLKRYRRKRYLASEKADKFLNDLNAEIELGWTGKGQTNHLLGRITMRCFIFHHVIAGGEPLSGQALIDEIISTAATLPGYKVWCRHQHEIVKRAINWARCIENSDYFQYGTQRGKYKATTQKSSGLELNVLELKPTPASNSHEKNKITWNQKQAIATRNKITETIKQLRASNNLPTSITNRFQALTQAGIGGSSLYRYKHLWHPKFEPSANRVKIQESEQSYLQVCQPARPFGAASWHNPTSLLSINARNSSDSKALIASVELSVSDTGRNSIASTTPVSFEDALTLTQTEIAQRIREQLAQTTQERSWVVKPSEPQHETQQRQQATQTAFLQRLVSYLSSGSPILVSEVLEILAQRPELLQQSGVTLALEEAFNSPQTTLDMQLRPYSICNIEIRLEIFRLLLRLGWSPPQIQHHLKTHFALDTLGQLNEPQLFEWRALLLRCIN